MGKNKCYIGATIRATESLGDIPPLPAIIKFHDPAEIFNPVLLDQAYENEDVGAVVYARIGFGEHAPVDQNGDPVDGYMFHVSRDTPFGCVLRSQFYLGATVANTPNPLTEEIGLGLMQHCYSEFTYLSVFWLLSIMPRIRMAIKLHYHGESKYEVRSTEIEVRIKKLAVCLK